MALQKTGVEAVVEGLSSFKSNVNEMNSSIASIGAGGNILTRTLGGAWDMLKGFGESVLHVAEYALGALLADAIEYVIGKLKELVTETIQAGAEFQTLSLRLDRLNLNAAMQSGLDYTEAMGVATDATKEQLTWLQKLAIQTPYDFQDIANVFTLAQSYGFAGKEAQDLTKRITDFAAGMGLGNTEIRRIIVNFGQMQAQGKVTSRELNDLARGAFVPVNDVLEIMQKRTGLTGAAFDDFRNSGEGVNAFLEAFAELVDTRFQGSAADMARTFGGATANAKDFVKSLVGFGIVKPILDSVGGKIADMISALTEPANWDKLTGAAGFLGTSLKYLLDDLLGGDEIDLSGVVDKIVEVFNKISTWINTHHNEILKFFADMKQTILDVWTALKSKDFEGFLQAIGLNDEVIGKIMKVKETITTAFDTITAWVDENGPLIEEFFGSLGEIVGGVFKNLAPEGAEGGLEGLLQGVTNFMTYVTENEDGIITFVTNMTKLWLVLQGIGLVLSIIGPPILAVLGFIIALGAAWTYLSAAGVVFMAIFSVIGTIIGIILSPIGILIGLIVLLAYLIITNWEYIAIAFEYLKGVISEWWTTTVSNFQLGVAEAKRIISEWWTSLWGNFALGVAEAIRIITKFKDDLVLKFKEMVSAIRNKIEEWKQLGTDIIEGLIKGITSAATKLIDAVVQAVKDAYDAAMNAIGANSPSKLFMNIGKYSMMGMAKGLEQYAGLAEQAMTEAVAGIAMPAMNMSLAGAAAGMGSQVNNSNSTTNNFGLTVNSSARTEPLIQDYGMMQALVGA